jgi:cell division protein ZapE
MRLIKGYEEAIRRGEIEDDEGQRQVLDSMQRLADDLLLPRRSWLNWLQNRPEPVGLYIYGPVGVGKTYLLDLFYQSIDEVQKVRIHFHHFMQQVDGQLRHFQGQKDPLKRIAANFAKTIRLLCFDEFMVEDVAHAMILAELLQALFAQGMILVATANTRPDELYSHGVQRERFLPAINLIKTHCEVICLHQERDYRLGRERLQTAYLYPLNTSNQHLMEEQFLALAGEEYEEGGCVRVQNRMIPFIKRGERTIWFDFKTICNLPRSQLDYLEIAERFDTVLISNIPLLTENDTVYAILLIHLMDVMYDQGIQVIMSAAVPPEKLYVTGELSTPFKRTLSRLQEMQSIDYLKRHAKRKVQNLV